MIDVTWTPMALSSFAIGWMQAIPTPPPTQTAFLNPSRWVGVPRGPIMSAMAPPFSKQCSLFVVVPIAWTTILIRPVFGSVSARVIGILSPSSSSLSITNCPGLAFFATSGASKTYSQILSARSLFSRMVNNAHPLWFCLQPEVSIDFCGFIVQYKAPQKMVCQFVQEF
ncbi:MAG: hypothetical protein BWX90_00418 [bacterium ADurb.Bin132]|nr:MAG: hypothetical protein BWX90_00418 [bacterium ADurb.Bin132]